MKQNPDTWLYDYHTMKDIPFFHNSRSSDYPFLVDFLISIYLNLLSFLAFHCNQDFISVLLNDDLWWWSNLIKQQNHVKSNLPLPFPPAAAPFSCFSLTITWFTWAFMPRKRERERNRISFTGRVFRVSLRQGCSITYVVRDTVVWLVALMAQDFCGFNLPADEQKAEIRNGNIFSVHLNQ